jgi:capsid protein
MSEYRVTWSIDVDTDDEYAAASEAWDAMRSDGSLANYFEVKDQMEMACSIDLADGSVGARIWMPSRGSVADLAEYLHAEQWDITEITAMIRNPSKYADQYSQMVIDREFDKVAKEPEAEDETGDIKLSQVWAHFTPEKWDGDQAVEVQVDWDQFEWNVTAETALGIRRQLTKRHHDWDWLLHDAMTPQWMKDWKGPFTIVPMSIRHTYEEGVYADECLHCGMQQWTH